MAGCTPHLATAAPVPGVGTELERTDLEIAECDAELSHDPGALAVLSLNDSEIDAERWLALFRAYRARDEEDEMKAAVGALLRSTAAPPRLVDRALFLMGNYYWAKLERDQASDYYRQLLVRQGAGTDSDTADWRIAWTAYLESEPDTPSLLRRHIENYPDSPYVPDALYWLGRLAERSDDVPTARGYYRMLSSHFVETYFGRLARQRLRQIPATSVAAGIHLALQRAPAVPLALLPAEGVPSVARHNMIGRWRSARLLLTIWQSSNFAPPMMHRNYRN